MDVDNIFEKAKTAIRESKYIEFKERLDPDSYQDWCEIIKDIVAIANSGGGCILIGIKNNGSPSRFDISVLEKIDSAHITDKIAKYTGQQFSAFEIREFDKKGYKIFALLIDKVDFPLVFIKPGTYPLDDRKQKTAFVKGTVYFRHGAKSEPAHSKDLEEFVSRKLNEIKRNWFRGIRKIVNAPEGYKVFLLPPQVRESTSPVAHPIRIVDDPNAPAYYKITPDKTHPNRGKDIIGAINEKLNLKRKINQYDIYCIRKVYDIEKNLNSFISQNLVLLNIAITL